MNTNNSSEFETSNFVTKIEIEPSLAVGEKDQAQELYLYPNPATTQLIILNLNKSEKNTNYTIFNTVGQLMLDGNLKDDQTLVNITSLPGGVYLVKIGTEVTKFVKQ